VFDLAGLLKKQDATAMGSPGANEEVRSRLAVLGDNGSAPRHVLHYAYPLDGTDLAPRPAIIDELTRVMEHHRAVAADDFDTFTGLLSVYFAECGWEYDGWECAVATS
jgi:hypothetical protein